MFDAADDWCFLVVTTRLGLSDNQMKGIQRQEPETVFIIVDPLGTFQSLETFDSGHLSKARRQWLESRAEQGSVPGVKASPKFETHGRGEDIQ
jgi:hypothetical protein